MEASKSTPAQSPAAVLSRQDFLGGLTIIAVAAFAAWLSRDLPGGAGGGLGPGTLPKALAALLCLLGLLLIVDCLVQGGLRLERWSLRGPLFVLGALVLFGLAVRPLGLVVAGPVAIVLSAFASEEVRWGETLLYGVLMTALCIGLFKFALGLPIPLAPWLFGY